MEESTQTTNRHKFLEEPKLAAVAKIEAELIKGARQYFDSAGFTEVVTPHITRATGACENIDTMFSLDYFGERSYLTQTGQLYLESLIPTLGGVFCIGPSFRAEPDVDNRHLTEFTLVEFELQCNLPELLEHIESLICTMVQQTVNSGQKELELLGADIQKLKSLAPPFKRISYTDAIKILSENGFSIEWGDDIKSEQEKLIAKHFGDAPVFITHYPEHIKFFNMRNSDDKPGIVNSTDLILPWSGEAVGAAEREYRHDMLYKKLEKSQMLQKLIAHGGGIQDFRWYLEHVKNNPVQHAGGGIGLNRVTQFVTGCNDIRNTTTFPMNRLTLL